jgi:hypothetical protein
MFPQNVTAVSDILTIVGDLGNKIPKPSWMLYLLEFYLNKKEIPVELDLVCSFNDDGKFVAVFGGNNQYTFKITPKVGHSYVREIIADNTSNAINYILNDLNTGESETFELNEGSSIKGLENISEHFRINNLKEIEIIGTDQFTGVEWHNKDKNEPFPIRYDATISLLQYGKQDVIESKSISYLPYRALIPDKDKDREGYPISFQNIHMKGCICYNVKTGNSNIGMNFNI